MEVTRMETVAVVITTSPLRHITNQALTLLPRPLTLLPRIPMLLQVTLTLLTQSLIAIMTPLKCSRLLTHRRVVTPPHLLTNRLTPSHTVPIQADLLNMRNPTRRFSGPQLTPTSPNLYPTATRSPNTWPWLRLTPMKTTSECRRSS